MKFLKILLFVAVLTFCYTSYSQKLPNVQQISVWGKPKFNINNIVSDVNEFQAYNKNTDIFYTLSNDNTKLYLTVKVIDPFIVKKIISGGLSFTIKGSDKSDEKFSVIFPTNSNSKSFILILDKPNLKKDTAKRKLDSLKNALNAQISNRIKLIEISGIKAIPDSLISIYNEYGIKASAFFDDQINYNYQLELPLKYINANLNNQSKLNYNIKVYGTIPKNASVELSGSGRFILVSVNGAAPYSTPVTNSPTDFSSEYILAKQQSQ